MKRYPPATPAAKRATKPLWSRGDQPEPLTTIDEAAAFLHCHRVTVLRLIRRGVLHLLKTGSTWSFARTEVKGLSNRNIAIYPHLIVARRGK